jgi:hypothetical protein
MIARLGRRDHILPLLREISTDFFLLIFFVIL